MPVNHWCADHKTVFFKKGKMKGFAHPILDDDGEPTGAWCNEKEDTQNEKPSSSRRGSTDTSIETQVCLKCACEIAKQEDSIETILSYAEKMWQWISGKH